MFDPPAGNLRFLRRKKRSFKIICCLLIPVLAVAAHALVYAVFVTSEDGRYHFMDHYVTGRYFLIFSKDNYHPAYYGPFWTENGLNYTVADTTLYPTYIPLTTPTPVVTATPLPTIDATVTPLPTTGPGTPTRTPSPYSTCTPSPVPTGWPTWPECPGNLDPCDFPECECDAYEPFDSEYAIMGEMLVAGWNWTHDFDCEYPCWYGPWPEKEAWDVTMSIDSTCYPTPDSNWMESSLYLDPDLHCTDTEINYTAQLRLLNDIHPCSHEFVFLYCNHSGTIPIVTPAIVSADDPTGPPLDYLTFDPDGMAWIRLRLSPDPHADRLRPLKLVLHAIGQDFEKDVPLLFSQDNMVLSDSICIYRSVSTVVPDLPCDCLVVPGNVQEAAIKISSLYECSAVPAVALDFLVEMTPTPGLQPSDKLKVSKWENAFGLPTGLPTPVVTPDFIDSDRYRFQIRVQDHAAGQSGTPGALTISSRIWNNQTPMPVDDETELILSPQGTPGVWITDPMILVSDDVDDDHMFFGVADDMPNDRTHKVTIDSEVVARYYPFGTATQTPAPRVIESSVYVEYKTFRYNTIIFTKSQQFPTPAVEPTWVHGDWERIEERYAQVGVKMIAEGLETRNPPEGALNADGEITALQNGPPNYELTNEMRLLLDSIEPTPDPSNFYLIYVPLLKCALPTSTPTSTPYSSPTPTPPAGSTSTPTPIPGVIDLGIALPDLLVCGQDSDRINNAIINGWGVQSLDAFFTSSHEIAHCLVNFGHFQHSFPAVNSVNVLNATGSTKLSLYDPTPVHYVFSTKRFSDTEFVNSYPIPPGTPKSQEERIHEHDQVH